MSQTHPHRIRSLLRTVYHLVAEGQLTVPEYTSHSIADAQAAIRRLTAGSPTGQLVFDISRLGDRTVTVPPAQVPVFRSDGAYLLTGGSGPVGLLLAERMAASGCGRIVLTSPTRPTPEMMQSISRIRATGAEIDLTFGDIAEADTARRMVAAATVTGLQVRGALHVAEGDESAPTPGHFDEHDWASKVYGAWNVHSATLDQPLDWFCTFSSVAELVGSPGQSASGASADSWLNGLASWRRAQGLPATAIAWGRWPESGRRANAGPQSPPEEGADVFETLLRHDRGYTGYAATTDMAWLTTLSQRSMFASAFRIAARGGGGKLRTELAELPREEWTSRLRRLISDQVGVVLRRNVDQDRPLAEYGIDSLGALELLTRVETETGIRLNAADIATASIRDLAALLCEKME